MVSRIPSTAVRMAAVGSVLIATFAATAAWAAPVRIFRTQSADAFGKGKSESVSIDAAGVVTLAPAADEVAKIEEPFAFALQPIPGGWAIGTGSDGKVLAIEAGGGSRVLLDAEEAEIFALGVGGDGALYAGSSPDGRLYRIELGAKAAAPTPFFDPEESYIWAVAPAPGGALWVATGAPGKLYRVDRAGKGEPLWEGSTHVRSLLPLPNGDLLFGTAGDGRLLRLRDGAVRTLYDSELTEIVALAAASDGSVWIATLASEASFVDLNARPPGDAAEGDDAKSGPAEEASVGSRPPGAAGARSEVVHLLANGSVEGVWSSNDGSVFALLPDGDAVWAATGLDGELFRFERGKPRVERKFEAKQLVALAAGSGGPAVLTTNGAGLWQLGTRRESKGSYTSAALDAAQVARFGVFRWQGTEPAGAKVKASFRSGFSSEPDDTWTPWADAREGRELSIATLERGRFVQYRLELEAGSGGAPRVIGTELTYRQENLRPAISSFGAMEPGQILVAAGFNPADQLYEPASPNREGIFDTLRATPPGRDRQKTVWRKGWLTLRWEANDANGDALESALHVRPEADPAGWLEIADEITESQWSIDSAALPDGVYRFRLTTTDRPGNEADGALEATRESEPVVIDQGAPVLEAVERKGAQLVARVRDDWSPLREAELSIDGAAWKPARAADGLLDGKSETFESGAIPAGAKLVLLRVVDAAWNVRTFDLLAEPKGAKR